VRRFDSDVTVDTSGFAFSEGIPAAFEPPSNPEHSDQKGAPFERRNET